MNKLKLLPIHPFPARMAPEIAINELVGLNAPKIILDPMAGSGTVLRAASELGHKAIGFDLDPLAVLMSRVWTRPFQASQLEKAALRLVAIAKMTNGVRLPWIDDCEETRKFVAFWFLKKQEKPLRQIAYALAFKSGVLADAMKIALSRIIITKERGASVARDTSHSRPHRVFFENDFDVYEGFLQSVRQVAARMASDRLIGKSQVRKGDSRKLGALPPKSVDVVITSPPYLNAIDYLRGHRLSLVWLGHSLPDLRSVRSRSIGAERDADLVANGPKLKQLLAGAGALDELPGHQRGMIDRYAYDVHNFMRELARVVKKDGRILLVVGNSCLKGISVSNAAINIAAAKMVGLQVGNSIERALPSNNRYLPLPSSEGSCSLSGRMRTETILSFCA